jgi:hypothetical protein
MRLGECVQAGREARRIVAYSGDKGMKVEVIGGPNDGETLILPDETHVFFNPRPEPPLTAKEKEAIHLRQQIYTLKKFRSRATGEISRCLVFEGEE